MDCTATVTVRTELDPSYPVAILHASGTLNGDSISPLMHAIHHVIDDGYRDLILEMSHTETITPACISALMGARSRFGDDRGRIVVARSPFHTLAPGQKSGGSDELLAFQDLREAQIALFQVSVRQFAPMRENTVRLRTWLRRLTASLHMNIGDRERIEAAASEAFANAVQHAAVEKDAPIHVRVSIGSAVLVEVRDSGPGFQARQYFTVNPALLHTGARGLGIYVMRNLMDTVEFISERGDAAESGTGTTVRLIKRLRHAGES